MSITGKELAKKLNLSATAVSMALHNKPGVSKETRDLVIKTAQREGYDFSKLRSDKGLSGTIYFIEHKSPHSLLYIGSFLQELIAGAKYECDALQYPLRTMMIHSSDIEKCIEDLRLLDCAGIILLGPELTEPELQMFLSLSVPLILISATFDALECSTVQSNNSKGAFIATNYLIERCGQMPGHLVSTYTNNNFTERKRGFEKALLQHGFSTGSYIEHKLSPTIEGAFTDMLKILTRKDKLATCYFADNDYMAIGAIKALKSQGYRIPEDIAFIGYDNVSECRIMEPALTTIDVSRYYMGQIAARQLLFQIGYPTARPVKSEIAPALVKRFSV